MTDPITYLTGASACAPSPGPYALWSVLEFRPGNDFSRSGTELIGEIGRAELEGVRVSGVYDVIGSRTSSAVMIWLQGRNVASLQRARRRLRRTASLRPLAPLWGAVGVHRVLELARAQPASMLGSAAEKWLAVSPFLARSEWYLLPPNDQAPILAERARKQAEFPGVRTNTLAAFTLGNYEWISTLESDILTDIVDLTRALRQTTARRYVQAETPAYVGRRISIPELLEILK